jgi:alkylation response protein AidB-like acyl-CoA dehydrogenase
MNFEPTDDQRAVLAAVDRIVERHAGAPLAPERFEYSDALARDLHDAGLLDSLAIDELGPVVAVATVMALSRLPLCAEWVAATLIAPSLDAELPRPIAVLWGRDDAPVRFLPMARSVVRVRGDTVETATLDATDVRAIESLFAYPVGVLRDADAVAWRSVPGADAAALRRLWQVGIAAETAGCLGAALASVIEHVTNRRQFGRPLGSFQAVQHRLAECATLIEGMRWLALHAASTQSPVDAATAAGFAQEGARRVSYDLHQFMGAMGLTLEHPLHRWTYRTKWLRAELGGAERQFVAAAEAAWPIQPRLQETAQ